MSKPNIILLTLAACFVFLIIACDDPPPPPKAPAPSVVSGKIIQPVVQNKLEKSETPEKPETPEKGDKKIEVISEKEQTPETTPKVENSGADVQLALEPEIESEIDRQEKEHYNSYDKIDPFTPLIQSKSEIMSIVDTDPERIRTPLEKIELSQIRLVAVIIMENKRIAMVEEASGKGYDVGIGTYIGKNRGKVSEIKKNSIIITELVKNFKGKIIEQVQEIKLHKGDNEE